MTDGPKTIIVTGSSGLVGSALTRHFLQLGYKVRAFQRSVGTVKHPNIEYYAFDLHRIDDVGFQGADYIVHCAYQPVISDFDKKNNVHADVDGVKKVVELSKKYGIKLIYLSTFSSHPEAISYYARHKLIAEGLCDIDTDLILKFPIVLGAGGGLCGRIASTIKKHRLIPMIGGGRQLTQTLALDDLCQAVEAGINKNLHGKFMIAHPDVIIMRDIYREIAVSAGVKPIFFTIPWTVAYYLLKLTHVVGVRLPFSAENVLGLKDLRTFDTRRHLEIFGLTVKDYRTTLRSLKL